jgi:hypothetical protein
LQLNAMLQVMLYPTISNLLGYASDVPWPCCQLNNLTTPSRILYTPRSCLVGWRKLEIVLGRRQTSLKLGWISALLTVEGQLGVGQKVKSASLLSAATLSGGLSDVQIIVTNLPISDFEKLSSLYRLSCTQNSVHQCGKHGLLVGL